MTKKQEKEEEIKRRFAKAIKDIGNGVNLRLAILGTKEDPNLSMVAFNKHIMTNTNASEAYSRCLISRASIMQMRLEELIEDDEMHFTEKKIKAELYGKLLDSYDRSRWGKQVTNKNENTNNGIDALADLISSIQKS